MHPAPPTLELVKYALFLLGSVLELRRVAGQWRRVIQSALGALAISLIIASQAWQAFVTNWPLIVSAIFFVIAICVFDSELTAKLGEGLTLLHSLAIVYWLSELTRAEVIGPIWLELCAAPVLFSLYHAFTRAELSRRTRLWLSWWSTLVIAVFGINYFINVVHLSDRSDAGLTYVLIECFLLGISGVYIGQNLSMLAGYIPGKNDTQFLARIKRLSGDHVRRYSSEQANPRLAVTVACVCFSGFGLNYALHWVSPDLAVWAALALIPSMIRMLSSVETTPFPG